MSGGLRHLKTAEMVLGAEGEGLEIKTQQHGF
jgi:hypothetical protein